ncbi:TonB-dependent receptor [Sphingomonas sp. DG1-23]|uniref:TonB-dependent receptor n=1 Tax=Sphingomonas sp. DG1-23 TaxID=3068316 RepID=UPI00273D4930|nr:TonB-dependent receptor [Sphingomonas sp. DG1-23]MDP5278740.1 TonB-dependent receptor [Sphingomonas sp. DG1-23]
MLNRNFYSLLATASALGLVTAPTCAAAQEGPRPSSAEEPGVVGADMGESEGDIVVTAIRRSLETAQAIKQDSDQIVDSIVAEDIGKLPDISASESLARVTGVQVTRNAGIAQGVTVRGLGDLSTTYNGREVFTAEGRYVQLQDFPSNGIARLDVFKSATADQLEPGLAGLIDVRSRRPLDFQGTRIAGAIIGLHWYQSQRLGLEANLLASTRWNTGIGEMGFLIEGSYADTKFTDSARNISQTILAPTAKAPLRYPSFVNTDYNMGTRHRPNAAASFQWRPSHMLEIYLDGLFQGYRGKNEPRNFQVASGDAAVLTNIELFEGTNLIRSMDASGGGLPNGVQQVNDQWTDTYQAGGGFIWKSDKIKITGDAAFTDSTFTNHNYAFNYQLTAAPGRHFEFDTDQGVGGGTVTLLNNFDLFNPALYRWTNIVEGGNRGHGRSVQGRLDLDYKLDSFGITNLQAGIRYSTRDADNYVYNRTDTAPAGRLFTLLPLDYVSADRGFRNDDATSLVTWLTPTRDSLRANIEALRTAAGQPTGRPSWGRPVYTGNEKTYTGYVQAKYAFDIGVPVDGMIGLRATRTETTIDGLQATSGASANQQVSRSTAYTDFLPNLSARFHFMPELQLRLAFTKTRTRPGFGQLNPTVTIGALPANFCTPSPTNPEAGPNNPDCIRPASSGNPDLKPIESTNYDASLEYYFSRSGSITVGVFRKDLNGFINNFTNDVADPEFTRLRFTRPENGGKGQINGIEAGARTFFRAPWLPDWLGKFGALVNYTYLDHGTELAPSLAATLPGMQRIAGISDHIFNVSGFYETRGFSARLSYNYRSDFVSGYGQVVDPGLGAGVLGPTLPVTEDGRGTMDFAATLSPLESVTLSFNATNLLGAAATNARVFNAQGQSYRWQTRFLESVYRVGIRFRF